VTVNILSNFLNKGAYPELDRKQKIKENREVLYCKQGKDERQEAAGNRKDRSSS